MPVLHAVPAARGDVSVTAVGGGAEIFDLGAHRRGRVSVRDLTSRQVAIGRILATGAKDAAIARQLGLSVRTVRAEISALITGLGARSRFQAGCLLVRRFG